MILINIDHSYNDDYFMIDTISVNMEDKEEKERIEKLAKKLENSFVDPDGKLNRRIADFLDVDVKLINIDTNEIDIM